MKLKTSLIAVVVFAFLLLPPGRGIAQERLCDPSFEDCRTSLWALIDAETVGIDVAFWFMQDTSLATKLINRHKAGVPVRVIVDPRGNSNDGNGPILDQLRAAGIPMRFKLTDGILHWKMMLFAGQNKLEFSGGNFSSDFFVPQSPFVNYIDDAVYFTDDLSVVQSFKKKYDDLWTDTIRYGNFGNITGPLTRRYPSFTVNPELNFPPSVDDSQDFFNRTQLNLNRETKKIDIIMYRITNGRYTDATLAAVSRSIPVRLIHEPNEYRNPARQWDSWNVDRMFMGGVQVKMRKHLGLNHEKVVLLYSPGMTIFGSSNWTGPSSNFQEEHNYFTVKPWFFKWFVDHFERKWNSSTENQAFVPLPPDQPAPIAPANGARSQPTTIKLEWEGGPWAHKYDIHFGVNPDPPLLVANASTSQSGAAAGQTLLDTGSVDDGVKETFTLPITLQPGTTYFWRIVGKTMANKTVSGPTWSFVTAGTPAPTPTPTPMPTPTPTPTPAIPAPVLSINATNRGIVLQSPLLTKEPFTVISDFNLSTDKRTRLMLFATNMTVTVDTLSQTTAVAVNSQGTSFQLPVEYVGGVAGTAGLTALIVRLPSDLSTGDVAISVTVKGAKSNSVMVAIRPP